MVYNNSGSEDGTLAPSFLFPYTLKKSGSKSGENSLQNIALFFFAVILNTHTLFFFASMFLKGVCQSLSYVGNLLLTSLFLYTFPAQISSSLSLPLFFFEKKFYGCEE